MIARAAFLVLFCLARAAPAQFVDDFDELEDWRLATGDGHAVIDMRAQDGIASVTVDATADTLNIWWAVIAREVASGLDLRRLNEHGQELRIEARVRASHAPRRVNLHLNTQRTTDFHSHLMEFYIPDTTGWHTISMTTRDFDARPGDRVNGQMALIDWGPGKYRVDLDYFKVSVVDTATAGPDKGEPIPYHPPIPDPSVFSHGVVAAHDAVIDHQYRRMNFNAWHAGENTRVLAVSGTQVVVLRWDFSAYQGRRVPRSGLLELTTHSLQRPVSDLEEFGQVRVVEILAGDPWKQETVTWESFTGGRPLDEVVNTQMIIDVLPSAAIGGKTYATIPRLVMQRLVDGATLGIALRPLGAITAAFYASEHSGGKMAPRLYFDTVERSTH